MEIGRVALVNYGEDYGKLVVIVDVIDQNRVSPFFSKLFVLIICLLAEKIRKGKNKVGNKTMSDKFLKIVVRCIISVTLFVGHVL